MGIGAQDLELILKLRRMGYVPNRANIVEIGAQQLSNRVLRDRTLLAQLGAEFAVSSSISWPEPIECDPREQAQAGFETLARDAPSSRELWAWLGFSYSAIDVDNSPDSIPLDLNFDSAPPALCGKFDLVTNFGTTEHVANQLNAFKVIHDLAGKERIMVHNLPSHGLFNHGLVNYNPKFFWMLARSNGYRLLHMSYFGDTRADTRLPSDIRGEIMRFDEGFATTEQHLRYANLALSVALEKMFDIEFVPPLDVPVGTTAPTPEIKSRYWTVFDASAFEQAAAGKRAAVPPRGDIIYHDARTTLTGPFRRVPLHRAVNWLKSHFPG
jgi:hypothetical protein